MALRAEKNEGARKTTKIFVYWSQCIRISSSLSVTKHRKAYLSWSSLRKPIEKSKVKEVHKPRRPWETGQWES